LLAEVACENVILTRLCGRGESLQFGGKTFDAVQFWINNEDRGLAWLFVFGEG
jgi:hypothetical protein